MRMVYKLAELHREYKKFLSFDIINECGPNTSLPNNQNTTNFGEFPNFQ